MGKGVFNLFFIRRILGKDEFISLFKKMYNDIYRNCQYAFFEINKLLFFRRTLSLKQKVICVSFYNGVKDKKEKIIA